MVLVEVTLGLQLVSLNGAWVLILLTTLGTGFRLSIWDVDDIALEMADHPNFWADGSREDFSSVGGFEVAGAVFVYLLLSLHLMVLFGGGGGGSEEYGGARL